MNKNWRCGPWALPEGALYCCRSGGVEELTGFADLPCRVRALWACMCPNCARLLCPRRASDAKLRRAAACPWAPREAGLAQERCLSNPPKCASSAHRPVPGLALRRWVGSVRFRRHVVQQLAVGKRPLRRRATECIGGPSRHRRWQAATCRGGRCAAEARQRGPGLSIQHLLHAFQQAPVGQEEGHVRLARLIGARG